jgi:hypothetical protein
MFWLLLGWRQQPILLPPQKEEVEPRRATRKKEKICKSFLPESRLNAPFEINPKPDTEPNK